MNNIDKIITQLQAKNNIIFYNKDIYPYYRELKSTYNCVYLNEPIPLKAQLINIINKITGQKKSKLNQLTITQLKELLIQKLTYKKLIIFFNHFERLTQRAIDVYEYLNSLENIIYVASFNNKFKKEAYFFFKKFKLINQKEYEEKFKKDEINVTYALYLIISTFCFIMYLKIALSLYLNTAFFAVTSIGALWFALIIFRTFIYAGGK